MYVHVYMCVCVKCVYACMCSYICMYVYVYIHVYMHTEICFMYIYTYICMYICMHILHQLLCCSKALTKVIHSTIMSCSINIHKHVCLKRNLFSLFLKIGSDVLSLMLSGTLFHNMSPVLLRLCPPQCWPVQSSVLWAMLGIYHSCLKWTFQEVHWDTLVSYIILTSISSD